MGWKLSTLIVDVRNMTLTGWRSYKKRSIPLLAGLFYTSLVAVLLQDAAQQSDESIVERLEANLQVHNKTAGRPFQLTMSSGIAHYDPARPGSLEERINHADALMYQQKQQRNSS
jgi:hypothetical protein